MKSDQIQIKRALAALLVIFLGTAVMAAQSPLEPVDTSNPRNTYLTFIGNMEQIREALENDRPREEYEYSIERVMLCFNLDEVAPAEQSDVGKTTALQLMEILGRIELPVPEDIPGTEAANWAIPVISIKIEIITDGERSGEYLFSAESVKRMHDFYKRSLTMPYRSGAWEKA